MKVSALNRDALTIVHVAWLSDAIRRLQRHDFQAVMVDLDLPDAKGLKALHALMEAAPHLPILVLGDDTVLQQMKVVKHGAHDYLLKCRLDANNLMRALNSSIARKAREGASFTDKRRAQTIINSIGDGVLGTDNAGLVTFLNPAAEKLIGWTYTDAVGRHLWEVFQVIDATTRERVATRMESKAQKSRTMLSPPNCLLVRRDGHESPSEDCAALVYDRNNHIAGLPVTFYDVTEPRAVAHKLAHLVECDDLKLGIARTPTRSNPVDSGECQSLLRPGLQSAWRFRSPARAALVKGSRSAA
jgi:PAS domain S-box-containing protein